MTEKQTPGGKGSTDPRDVAPGLPRAPFVTGVKILSAKALSVCAWAAGALALFLTPPASGTTHQDHADIARAAQSFVAARAREDGSETRVTADALDSRLRLALCGEALETFLPPGGRVGPRTTVGVRCPGPTPWKLYVPVRLTVRAPVFVAARYLRAGDVLKSGDLRVEQVEIGHQRRAYLRADQTVEGMVMRRDLAAGEPLRDALLDAPTLVHRGQKVTLTARGGVIAIRMAGIALASGRAGQRIRVRNRSSGRVVEGIVRSAHRVEIGLH